MSYVVIVVSASLYTAHCGIWGYMWKFRCYENHDLAIARSSSSRANPGLRLAFKCLNVSISATALAAWLEAFKCLNV